MLARRHRLVEGPLFAATVRRGRRAGRSTLVLHLQPGSPATLEPARVGFVVSRAVGPAVARNRVVRRLRHLMRDRIPALPGGSTLVVRALPPAAAASSTALGADLDRALARVQQPAGAR